MKPKKTIPKPIQRALVEAETTLKDVAAEIPKSVSHVFRVVAGERRSPLVEQFLIKRLKLSPQDKRELGWNGRNGKAA